MYYRRGRGIVAGDCAEDGEIRECRGVAAGLHGGDEGLDCGGKTAVPLRTERPWAGGAEV